MGLAHSPGVVSNGLIFALDAGNSKSYPGSGTTCFDIAGNNDATLVNGVQYSGNNLGSFVFDGTNDYIVTTTLPTLSVFTISLWVNVLNITGEDEIFYSNGDSVTLTTYNNRYMVYTGTVNQGSLITTNVWKYVNIVGNGSSIKLYLNDTLDSSWNTGRAMNGGNTALGHIPNSRYANMEVSTLSIYNRDLTEQEIVNNFNSLRRRFGV